MTAEEYKKEYQRLEDLHTQSLKELALNYAKENNPYKVGDIFTDHMGSIIIETIKAVNPNIIHRLPSCSYFGLELKKDGTPRKDKSKRTAYQTNDVLLDK
jgi:hypothetical protein